MVVDLPCGKSTELDFIVCVCVIFSLLLCPCVDVLAELSTVLECFSVVHSHANGDAIFHQLITNLSSFIDSWCGSPGMSALQFYHECACVVCRFCAKCRHGDSLRWTNSQPGRQIKQGVGAEIWILSAWFDPCSRAGEKVCISFQWSS